MCKESGRTRGGSGGASWGRLYGSLTITRTAGGQGMVEIPRAAGPAQAGRERSWWWWRWRRLYDRRLLDSLRAGSTHPLHQGRSSTTTDRKEVLSCFCIKDAQSSTYIREPCTCAPYRLTKSSYSTSPSEALRALLPQSAVAKSARNASTTNYHHPEPPFSAAGHS